MWRGHVMVTVGVLDDDKKGVMLVSGQSSLPSHGVCLPGEKE